ncbi:hypothetical protein J6590_018816 [Homalodisca vitripennis]|nr:hypothetical protein J6590_018816 [Homalodisca vitripennis]
MLSLISKGLYESGTDFDNVSVTGERPRDWDRWEGRGRRLRAANQLRVNRTALPFSHPHVTPQSQSLPSNRFVRFTL